MSETGTEAIQLCARMVASLDEIERHLEFQKMDRSAEDIRQGRVLSHEEMKEKARSRRPRG